MKNPGKWLARKILPEEPPKWFIRACEWKEKPKRPFKHRTAMYRLQFLSIVVTQWIAMESVILGFDRVVTKNWLGRTVYVIAVLIAIFTSIRGIKLRGEDLNWRYKYKDRDNLGTEDLGEWLEKGVGWRKIKGTDMVTHGIGRYRHVQMYETVIGINPETGEGEPISSTEFDPESIEVVSKTIRIGPHGPGCNCDDHE